MYVSGAKEQILVSQKYPISEVNLPPSVPVVIKSPPEIPSCITFKIKDSTKSMYSFLVPIVSPLNFIKTIFHGCKTMSNELDPWEICKIFASLDLSYNGMAEQAIQREQWSWGESELARQL